MKFVPYDRKKLKHEECCSKTKNQKFLEAFIASGVDCAKVVDHGYCHAKSCSSALRGSIKTFGMNKTIKCVLHKGEVYLIRLTKK